MARQHVKAPESFVGDLAAVLYSAESIDRANAYARSRGLNPDLFPVPWAATSSDPGPFERFRDLYPPIIFTDCLYIPIVQINSDPTKPGLAGFDIRYLGDQPFRLRWSKRKRTQQTQLIYNPHAVLKGESIIVTEGAADAESFRTAGWEAIAALTALKSDRFVHFLIATGRRVYLAFDNDDDGIKARDWLLEYIGQFPLPEPFIRPLVYPYKDPNKFLETVGLDAFRAQFAYQLV